MASDASPKRAPRLTLSGKLAVLAAVALTTYVWLSSSRTNSDVILLRNAAGSEAHILKTGAIIQKLLVADRDGNFADVVLGFEEEARYLRDSPYFGAVVGRVANRIANATFELDGATYRLATNEGGMPGTLHGGARGFDKVAWNVLHRTADKLVLEYTAADGEEGYPGELHVKVRYELTARSELVFEVTAHTTKPTPINIAQHSYFNLGGHGSGSILDHVLTLHKATHVLPIDSHRIPRGLQPVANTPFDFLTPRPIGVGIGRVDGPGWRAGYDHCFALHGAGAELARDGASVRGRRSGDGPPTPQLAATLYHPGSGRTMEVHTTLPGIQLYTSNFLDGSIVGKGGAKYEKYAGVCLETEGFPDAIHHANWPTVVLRPGETFRHRTLYSFSARDV